MGHVGIATGVASVQKVQPRGTLVHRLSFALGATHVTCIVLDHGPKKIMARTAMRQASHGQTL
jgi:hypothetical protein